MAIKFADTPQRTRAQPFCPNERCVLHCFRESDSHSLRPVSYRRGTILLEQGQPALGCYAICNGWVKVARRTVRGKTAAVDLRGPGELIGAREILAREPILSTYAQAVSAVQAVWIERAYLVDVMSRFPEIALAISQRIAQINGAVQRRLSYALHAGLEERLAYLLSYLHQKQSFVKFVGGGGSLRTFAQKLFSLGIVMTTCSLSAIMTSPS